MTLRTEDEALRLLRLLSARDADPVPGRGGIDLPSFGTPAEYRDYAAQCEERAMELEVTAAWTEARWAAWEALPTPDDRERAVAEAVAAVAVRG